LPFEQPKAHRDVRCPRFDPEVVRTRRLGDVHAGGGDGLDQERAFLEARSQSPDDASSAAGSSARSTRARVIAGLRGQVRRLPPQASGQPPRPISEQAGRR